MQQGGGGSQYGASPFSATPTSSTDPINPQQQQQHHLQLQLQQQQQRIGDLGAAEEASPISSRPPAGAHLSSPGIFDEHLLRTTAGLPDDDALGGDDMDRGGSSGNRWPRQETLALLKIRSDMDQIFRDATLKGPLWEDVSRKLGELGYKRSAKKCKEKFENVHKYYKRTKESRAGRQDGKSYKFFTQLEALHSSIGSPSPLATTIQPTSMSNVRAPTPLTVTSSSQAQGQAPVYHTTGLLSNPDLTSVPGTFLSTAPTSHLGGGVSFLSDSSSGLSGSDDMDDELDLEADMMEAEPSNRQDLKRKRGLISSSSASRKMMDFFEGLMKQVMQKQEDLQHKFLQAIEKREHDRMIREEAWKRQEMATLAREHDLMAQERATSASRDSAIINFLQKITGQTVQLPPAVTIPTVPQPSPPPLPQVVIPASVPPPPPQVVIPVSVPQPPPPQPPTELYPKIPPPPQQQQHQQQQQVQQQPMTMSMEIVSAIPEQQVAPQDMSSAGFEATSSRWPKAEVLALIKLRSGLEPRYQEAGPKGPLWEEISAGMHRMSYKRNPKRCKEKWENINKYFKKVKESNKKRPEDAKTCPYFHELDALYRNKILGATPTAVTGTGGSSTIQQPQLPHHQNVIMDTKLPIMPSTQSTETTTANVPTSNGDLTATLFGEGSDSKKPEDILKAQQHQIRQQLTRINDFDKNEQPDSDINLDQDQDDEYDDNEDDDDDDDDDDDYGDEEAQEEMKMAYKIQFQRPNAGSSSNGGGNGTTSYLAMVQ